MSETITITVPSHVKAGLTRMAAARGVQVEDLLTLYALEQTAAFDEAEAFFRERAARAKPGAFERVFGTNRTGGEPPREGDELP
jgi:hypothetical protein